MNYGIINTNYADPFNARFTDTVAPSDVAVAIALCMPSVERSGQRAQRGGLKSPGLATYYHAMTMRWGGENPDVTLGCNDLTFSTVTAQGSPSNKQNHLTGLIAAGFIQRYRSNGQWFTALTDAGLAQVKAVSPELAKLAKGYTVAARDKAIKAALKAAQPAKPARKRKAKPVAAEVTEPVSDQPDTQADPATIDYTAENLAYGGV